MTATPRAGIAVVLRDQNGGAYRSRVESADGARLALHPPADGVGDRIMTPGTRLLVTWPDEYSLWVLPVVLVELQPTADGSMLAVEVNGDPWREERRQYARATIPAELDVQFTAADGVPAPVPASLINLSEVALRCAMAPEHQDLYQPRVPVVVRIRIGASEFVIPGYVLQSKATVRDDHSFEVVILFDRPVERVDELRAQLSLS